MTKHWRDGLIALAVAALVIAIGDFYIRSTPFNFMESAILYLTGVLAGGMFWIGRKKD